MAMGTRKQREKQAGLWIAQQELAAAPGHPFYQKPNELLEAERFDEFVEKRCVKFYAEKYGRPSLTPGIYFRALLIGYFEGIGAERGIAWRLADSLAPRRFVGIALDEYTPDHSTIARTRRLIDVDTHREVFAWVLGVLADRGLLKGQRIAIDATTLEANAAMRSIVRRDTGESYEEFLRGLAKASGIDFRYYRCSGSDGYRFGGERICSNAQIQGQFLESAVWHEVCELLTHPERLEHEYQGGFRVSTSLENVETLRAQRLKLQHALELLIDSFTEGLIEKDQFTSRMARTKTRIAKLDTKIKDHTGDVDQLEHLRLAASRLRELAAAVGPHFANSDWHRRRDMIRTLVQRIEIGLEDIKIVFRMMQDARCSGTESIVVTLSRI